jgi:hypothetical protein
MGSFYSGMAALLLGVVVVGFGRTYFSRSLPVYLHVHGWLLALWFTIFFAQTVLVARHRVAAHRTLGVFGSGVAALACGLTVAVIIRAIGRSPANGIPLEFMPALVVADLAAMLRFAVFVTLGVVFRRRPEVHKRLMLLASISIVGAAISRLPGVVDLLPLSVLLAEAALLGALIVHDLQRIRRVHPATAWGEAFYVATTVGAFGLAFTRGPAILRSLE